MSGERLVRFYAATGHRIVRTESATWFDASSRIYQSVPGVTPVDPPRAELDALLGRQRLVGVQFATCAGYGLPSAAYVVRDEEYRLESTHRTFRQNVRRGARECEVREIGFRELERLGLPVNRDALARRGYRDPRFLEAGPWHRYCEAAATSAGAGALGSFHRGALASYLIYLVDEEGVCHGLHMFSRLDARGHRPNHLLYFEFTRRMISRPDVRSVSTGLEPVPPAGEIDRFKRHAGYRKEPRRLAVALHRRVEPLLLSRAGAAILDAGLRFRPRDPRLRRIRAVAEMARATRIRD